MANCPVHFYPGNGPRTDRTFQNRNRSDAVTCPQGRGDHRHPGQQSRAERGWSCPLPSLLSPSSTATLPPPSLPNSVTHPPTHPLTHLLLTHARTHSPTHSFARSLARAFIRSFVRSLTTHPFTHSFTHPAIHSLARPLTHSLTHSPARSLAHSLKLYSQIILLSRQLHLRTPSRGSLPTQRTLWTLLFFFA